MKNMYLFLLSILYLLLKATGTKEVIFGHNNFTEYQVGNMNLILSVPHGGSMEPKDIPDWEAACWDATTSSCIFSHDCPSESIQNYKKCKVSTSQDRYTIEVAQALAEDVNKITDGFFLHIITNHLQVFKMDANSRSLLWNSPSRTGLGGVYGIFDHCRVTDDRGPDSGYPWTSTSWIVDRNRLHAFKNFP